MNGYLIYLRFFQFCLYNSIFAKIIVSPDLAEPNSFCQNKTRSSITSASDLFIALVAGLCIIITSLLLLILFHFK